MPKKGRAPKCAAPAVLTQRASVGDEPPAKRRQLNRRDSGEKIERLKELCFSHWSSFQFDGLIADGKTMRQALHKAQHEAKTARIDSDVLDALSVKYLTSSPEFEVLKNAVKDSPVSQMLKDSGPLNRAGNEIQPVHTHI